MYQYQEISRMVYGVEKGTTKRGDVLPKVDYLVLDTMDTNVNTIGNESEPKENSMQAMAVEEIKISTNLV